MVKKYNTIKFIIIKFIMLNFIIIDKKFIMLNFIIIEIIRVSIPLSIPLKGGKGKHMGYGGMGYRTWSNYFGCVQRGGVGHHFGVWYKYGTSMVQIWYNLTQIHPYFSTPKISDTHVYIPSHVELLFLYKMSQKYQKSIR